MANEAAPVSFTAPVFQSKTKRLIKYIILHCTAGHQNQTIESIKAYWKNVMKWKNPGYHIIIKPDGSYEVLADFDKIVNGVKGYNANSINISYIGGIDLNGRPTDNRTQAQMSTMLGIVNKLKSSFPNAVVLGHRDFSTDNNGNGILEEWEYIKACPSFDVRQWLKSLGLETAMKPTKIVYKLNYPLISDNNVVKIQKALESFGYKFPMYGNFGEITDAAVKDFQKTHGLVMSGIVDEATLKLLKIQIS